MRVSLKKVSSSLSAALMVFQGTLMARDISPKEYEIYAAENYRVDFAKLPKSDQDKLKNEYDGKIKLAQAITKKTENDPLFNAARDFKTLEVWSKQIASTVDVSEKNLKELFGQQQLKVAPKYKLRNILVKTEFEAQEITKKLSSYEGEKLQTKFISYVKEKSIDPSTKEKEGDGGWVDISTMPKVFIDQLADKPKYSLVLLPEIKDLGYQLLLIEDIAPEHIATFDEAKDFLVKLAIEQAIEQEAKKLLNLTPSRKSKP